MLGEQFVAVHYILSKIVSRSMKKVTWIQIFKNTNIFMTAKQNIPDLHLWHVCYQSVCTATKNIPYNLVVALVLLHNPPPEKKKKKKEKISFVNCNNNCIKAVQ